VIERGALQHRLRQLVAKLPAVQVQNRLMACTDRDIALALMGMTPAEAQSIVSHVSSRKASRVLEELALEERRRVEERHVIHALNVVITSLAGERSIAGPRSYVRPRRTEDGASGRRRS
jgi:Mg/Co/Ni transporter MgtE